MSRPRRQAAVAAVEKAIACQEKEDAEDASGRGKKVTTKPGKRGKVEEEDAGTSPPAAKKRKSPEKKAPAKQIAEEEPAEEKPAEEKPAAEAEAPAAS